MGIGRDHVKAELRDWQLLHERTLSDLGLPDVAPLDNVYCDECQVHLQGHLQAYLCYRCGQAFCWKCQRQTHAPRCRFRMDILFENTVDPLRQRKLENWTRPGSVRACNVAQAKAKMYAQAKIGILTPLQKQYYDVLTQQSNSYFTSEFKVDKRVGESLENFAPFCITHSKRMRTETAMHGAVGGGTGMATKDVQRMETRSKRLEETLLSLWDHIRVKSQELRWLHSFLEGMDNDEKIHTLSALVFMDEHDEQAHDNGERVLGKDISFDKIVTLAACARNNYEDPVARLTNMCGRVDTSVPSTNFPEPGDGQYWVPVFTSVTGSQ